MFRRAAWAALLISLISLVASAAPLISIPTIKIGLDANQRLLNVAIVKVEHKLKLRVFGFNPEDVCNKSGLVDRFVLSGSVVDTPGYIGGQEAECAFRRFELCEGAINFSLSNRKSIGEDYFPLRESDESNGGVGGWLRFYFPANTVTFQNWGCVPSGEVNLSVYPYAKGGNIPVIFHLEGDGKRRPLFAEFEIAPDVHIRGNPRTLRGSQGISGKSQLICRYLGLLDSGFRQFLVGRNQGVGLVTAGFHFGKLSAHDNELTVYRKIRFDANDGSNNGEASNPPSSSRRAPSGLVLGFFILALGAAFLKLSLTIADTPANTLPNKIASAFIGLVGIELMVQGTSFLLDGKWFWPAA